MKYETPEVTVLTSAVNAIEAVKYGPIAMDGVFPQEHGVGAHEDWE